MTSLGVQMTGSRFICSLLHCWKLLLLVHYLRVIHWTERYRSFAKQRSICWAYYYWQLEKKKWCKDCDLMLMRFCGRASNRFRIVWWKRSDSSTLAWSCEKLLLNMLVFSGYISPGICSYYFTYDILCAGMCEDLGKNKCSCLDAGFYKASMAAVCNLQLWSDSLASRRIAPGTPYFGNRAINWYPEWLLSSSKNRS